ncbi:translation initiation factor IF-2 [Candidatus Gracilibacteria bacterium]|nr:translation initiation factor IF-2 [Candidatus Gracilibacteria bacterium]
MNIRKIAKEIGITTQTLKKEIPTLNLGLTGTETEVPEHLASAIIRIVGPKHIEEKIKRLEKEGASAQEIENVKNGDFYRGGGEEVENKVEVKKEVKKKILEDENSVNKAPKVEKIKSIFDISEEIDEKISVKEDEREKQRKIEEEKEAERKKLAEQAKKERAENRKKKFGKKSNQPINLDSLPTEIGSGKIKFSPKTKKGKGVSITRKIKIDEEDLKIIKKNKAEKKKKEKFKELSQEEIDAMPEDEQLLYFAEMEEFKRAEKENFKNLQKKKSKVIKTYDNQEQIKKKEGVIEISAIITVKEFSEKVGIPVPKIIGVLIKNGIMATINHKLDFDTASLIALELDVQVKKKISEASAEELQGGDLSQLIQDEPENLQERPPVVVVMGHVDHGKTSILDFYRNANVVDKESGGITQHIGAYQIVKNGRKITFLDTPGHAAFTEMRARGAKVTDIAILVVAADDGVKPQTIEAFNHAKDAGVSIIIAMNKMDKEAANVDKVKGELAEIGAMPEDWGGDIPVIPVSAKKGTGMDDLLETILLTSDVNEPKANPNRTAIGTIIESNLDKALGPIATVLVNTGTLNVKDVFIAGSTMGKVKSITDTNRKRHKKLEPSGVSVLAGFEEVPSVGDILQVVKNEKIARQRVEEIKLLQQENLNQGFGIEEIQNQIKMGKINLLKVVLKADSQGSLEALKGSIEKIKNDEVGVKIIHAGIGSISEADVSMAAASGGMIFGFHVGIPVQARTAAEKSKIEIREFKIIYELLDEIKGLLTGMLEIEEVEKEVGTMTIKQIFYTKKKMMIVGGSVDTGSVYKEGKIKLMREGEIVGESTISNLQSGVNEVDEMNAGNDCGIQLNPALDIKEGDKIVVSVIEKITKTLD